MCYSCYNQKDEQEKLISNNNYKYWNEIKSPTDNCSPIIGYCFNSDGHYCKFYYFNNKRYDYGTTDIVVDRTWQYLNDSSFYLNGKESRILVLNNDSFVFQKRNNDTIILIASPDQSTPILLEDPYKNENNIIGDTLKSEEKKNGV